MSTHDDDITWAADELENATWTWAKTMAKTCPHWWTHRRQWSNTNYMRVLDIILKHGIKKRWRNQPVRSYLQPGNGYEYWCMIEGGNWSRNDSLIINRAEIKNDDA